MERMHEIMRERVEADEAFDILKKERQKTLDRLDVEIAHAGPIKLGDIVDITGFSHRGKKMIVDHLWIVDDWDVGVKAKGRVLKKDGTPGLLTAIHFIEVAVAP